MAWFTTRRHPSTDLHQDPAPPSSQDHPTHTRNPAASTPTPNGVSSQYRGNGDHRSNGATNFVNGNGAMPVPTGPQHMMNGAPQHNGRIGGAAVPFHARSPPNTKNTSHVPCKFFRLGQCQAGKACPFSHSTDIATVDTPCKYFAKGNCKFGSRCALAHILPNGRRVNRPNGTMGGPLNLGGRVDPQMYNHQDSALANSLLSQQANGSQQPFGYQYSQLPEDNAYQQGNMSPRAYNNIPSIDTGHMSQSGSQYGSPQNDHLPPLSPIAHLSIMDAQLPASFDSQGISHIARYGPVASSVPAKFGMESPPTSLPQKVAAPSNALRSLHDSAFGRDNNLKAPNLGSSPANSGDEGGGYRIMHSQRVSRPKMLSASVPRQQVTSLNDDWDDGLMFGGEEDLIPTSLHDLLTPQEKMRRLSRNDTDLNGHRDALNVLGTSAETTSRFGSPGAGNSPSRFVPLFAKHRREEEQNGVSNSPFGHIGSPLRNSPLQSGASPGLRTVSNPLNGDVSPNFASPPRQSSMSMLSQQLQRTRISRSENHDTNGSTLHPVSARHTSNSNGRLDRALSSSSINNSRIEEEPEAECVFSMEEVESNSKSHRYSGGWNYPVGGRSPRLTASGAGRHALGVHDGKDLDSYLSPGR